MSDSEYQILLDHLRTTMTVVGLLTGFIFTALITLLIGLEDVASSLSQITLFVLLLSFQVSMLYLGILQGEEAVMTWHVIKAKSSPPRFSISRYANLLSMVSIQLLGIAVDLMFFLRTLIYLGLIPIVVGGSVLVCLYIMYRATGFKTIKILWKQYNIARTPQFFV